MTRRLIAAIALPTLAATLALTTPSDPSPPGSVAAQAVARPQSTPWSYVLPAVADTWGWQTVTRNTPPPPAIHGAEASLVTGIDDTRGIQVALVRFDLSGLPQRADWLQSASLELTATGESRRTPVHWTRVYPVTSAWDEASTADDDLPDRGAELDRRDSVPGQVTPFDVKAVVARWLSGTPNHGLALTTTEDRIFTRTFASREADAGQPRLVVWFMPPMISPTPTGDTATPGPPADTPTPSATPDRPTAGPTASATPTTPPTPTVTPAALPDLDGVATTDCYSTVLHVTVRNRGTGDAGPFWVRSTVGRPAWRVPGLPAGSRLDLAPQPGTSDPLLVDADSEVRESNEQNNRVPVSVPVCERTFMPYAGRWR